MDNKYIIYSILFVCTCGQNNEATNSVLNLTTPVGNTSLTNASAISVTVSPSHAIADNQTIQNSTMEYIKNIVSEYESDKSKNFDVFYFSRYILFKVYLTVYSTVKLMNLVHLNFIYTTFITIYSICSTYIIYRLRKKSTTTISDIAMDHFYHIRGNPGRRRSETVKSIVKV